MDLRELAHLKAEKVVDARLVPCACLLLRAKKEIGSLEVGQILEILSHDPEAGKDISSWAGKVGQEFLGLIDSSGLYRIF